MMKHSTLFIRPAAVLLFVMLGTAGCQRGGNVPPDFQVPSFLKPYIKPGDCPACTILDEIQWGQPGDRKFTGGIEDPAYGPTFFVNIDYDRVIIKLKPVRDIHEPILLYDPYHQGSKGAEVGSHYIQPRCDECNGNRFLLGAGVSYRPGADAEDYTEFVLVGKCTLCGKRKVLYSSGG